MFEEIIEQLIVNFGLFGFFFASIIANASIILPIPIDLVVFGYFGYLGFQPTGIDIIYPFIVGLVVGTGAAIGELSGYFIGLMGIKSFEKMKKSEVENINHLKEKIANAGIPIIAFFAFTPLPFDAVGLAAGLIKYSIKKFFIGCWVGKVPRYIIIAYAGLFGVQFVKLVFGF
jgi:membrane protein YqaA with SNARE-associated domain